MALAAAGARNGPSVPTDALLMLAEHLLRAKVPLETLARRSVMGGVGGSYLIDHPQVKACYHDAIPQ